MNKEQIVKEEQERIWNELRPHLDLYLPNIIGILETAEDIVKNSNEK